MENDTDWRVVHHPTSRLLYMNPVCVLCVPGNMMTITWLTCIDNAGNVLLSVNKKRHTSSLLSVGSRISLNVVHPDDDAIALSIGKCTGSAVDKWEALDLERNVAARFLDTPALAKKCKGFEDVPVAPLPGNESVVLLQVVEELTAKCSQHHRLLLCRAVIGFVRKHCWNDANNTYTGETLSFLGNGTFSRKRY